MLRDSQPPSFADPWGLRSLKACLARPDADPSRLRGMDEYLIVFKNAIQTKPLQRYVRPWCTKPIRLERISLQLWGNAAQTHCKLFAPASVRNACAWGSNHVHVGKYSWVAAAFSSEPCTIMRLGCHPSPL